MTARSEIRDLFLFRPSPVRWPIALQAGIAMGLPLLVFTVAGEQQLGLLASIGAFVSLYLTKRSRLERALALPLVAVILIADAALGIASSAAEWSSILMLLILTIGSSLLFLGLSVGPPGVLFPVLVVGVSTHLAAPASLGGVGIDGSLVLTMMAIGSGIAYLVVIVPLALPGIRRRDVTSFRAREPFVFGFEEQTRIVFVRIVIAAAIAAALAAPLGIHRGYWVTLTLVAILQNGHRLRLTAVRGIHRVLGTIVGVGLFAAISTLHPRGYLLVVVLAGLQFLVELVVIRNYGLALILITPLALTISSQGSADVGGVIVDRIVDTLIGAGIALVVLLGSLGLRHAGPQRWRMLA